MSESLLPHPVEGQMRSGLRRALRAAALAPVVAGTLTFLTAGLVRAEEVPTQQPTENTPTEAPVVAPVPTIESIVARPGALTVSFLPAEGTSPLFHIVQAKVGDEVKATQVVLGDVRTASLTGLENDVEHDVVVAAIDLLGLSDLSSIVKATPVSDGSAVVAPLAVEDVHVERTNISATVTWTAPTKDGGSPIQGFVVNAVDQSTGKLVLWRTLPADVRSASVAPLTHGVAYDINVFAVSGTHFGALETVTDVLGSNALDNPLAPSLPWATAYVNEDGEVVANWGAAQEHGVPVLGYNAVIVQDGQMVGWNLVDAAGRAVEVTGLDAEKDAEVYVFGSSSVGYGEPVKVDLPAVTPDA